jgi:hypothetical protein
MLRNYTALTIQYGQRLVPIFSLRFSKKLIVPAICLTVFVAVPGYGQAPSGAVSPDQAGNICEGQLPAQKALNRNSNPATGTTASADSEDPQSGSDTAKDHLKLSIKTSSDETPSPEGQYCKRERPSQSSRQPSATSPQSDNAPQSSQPAPPAPIAQLKNGELFIQANGQDLASVIDAIRSATGISVEMPAESQPEPVFLSMGPASTKDALIALIEGSKYNYIIVGSEKDPQLVKRLILSERTSSGSASLVASAHEGPGASEPTLYGGQGVKVDTEAEASEPPPPPPPPIQPASIPSSVPTGINIQQMAAQSGKTTGQILDELQKHQEQVLDEQAAQQQQQQQ